MVSSERSTPPWSSPPSPRVGRDHGQRADALLGGLAAGTEDRLDRPGSSEATAIREIESTSRTTSAPASALRLARPKRARPGGAARRSASRRSRPRGRPRGGLAPGGDLLGPLVDQQDDELDVGGCGDRAGEGAKQGRTAGAGTGVDENPLTASQRQQQVDRAQQHVGVVGAAGPGSGRCAGSGWTASPRAEAEPIAAGLGHR